MAQLTRPAWIHKPRADFDAAVLRAYASFKDAYSDWADYLFDEHFLTGAAASIFDAYHQEGIAPEPHDLARRWASQVFWPDQAARRTRTAHVTLAAERFLCFLATELRALAATDQAELADDDCGPGSKWKPTAGLA